jgi:Zn-dependent protease with chaperone function
LTPHPWYSAYHYSHPTTLERVKAIEAVRLT